MTRLLLVIVVAFLLWACGRHVVASPQDVEALDNRTWYVLSEPDAAAPPPPH